MTSSEKNLTKLYTAIANGKTAAIEECYTPTVKFSDPIFGVLKGNDVCMMWKMLFEKSRGNLKIEYTIIKTDEYTGSARWTASYKFGKKNRKIVNLIHSQFRFKNGLIIQQNDDFDIWKWSKQAFSFSGFLFGWTGYMQKRIQKKALLSLNNFKIKNS